MSRARKMAAAQPNCLPNYLLKMDPWQRWSLMPDLRYFLAVTWSAILSYSVFGMMWRVTSSTGSL